MAVVVRLFGPGRVEITDLDSWRLHAPPENGDAQWKDGYSAKEQAKAWLRGGSPAVPEELWSAIAPLAPGGVDEIYGRPEHQTRLDDLSRARQHDMFACLRRNGETVLVVGIEAKACEDFGGVVADRAAFGPPSDRRARCNLLARALFGRAVLEEETGEIVDQSLAPHGYQLWTAAVGTLIEAQRRELDHAALVVHQFRPRDLSTASGPGDRRDWQSALTANAEGLEMFVAELERAGSRSHQTDFVKPGTALHVLKLESIIDR